MTKVLYYKSKETKYCITKVNKDVIMAKVLYYKSKQRCYGHQSIVNKDVWPKYCITKVNKSITKVLYYKSKQRCYDQSIALQM